MIAQERYDKIISSIELSIENRSGEYWEKSPDLKEIGTEAFKAGDCEYIDERSRNEVFKFMTGMTLKQYISYRTMMYAYKTLITQDDYRVSELVNITGVSGEPALYKKFKETFNMTPREAFDLKDNSFYREPAFWDKLSIEDRERFIESVEVIKEVPVEVIKKDRTPYIIVSVVAITAIIITIFSILFSRINVWSGEYIVLAQIIDDHNYPHIVRQSDCKAVFYPFKGKVKVYSSGEVDEYDMKINNDSATISRYGISCATCYRKNDGSIILDMTLDFIPNDLDIESLRLIPTDVYDVWKEQWQGIYSGNAYNENGFLNAADDYSVTIVLDWGVALIGTESEIQDLSTAFPAIITDFNGDSLTYHYPNETRVYHCTSMGENSFTTILEDNGHFTDLGTYFKIAEDEKVEELLTHMDK